MSTEITVPYVSLFMQLNKAFSTMQIENMKSVEHEDDELNNDYSIDPLADPRLDKMDLFNLVDSEDRDKIMNGSPSFNVGPSDDSVFGSDPAPATESTSDSGSGE